MWRLGLGTVFLNFKIAICNAKDFCSLYLVCVCFWRGAALLNPFRIMLVRLILAQTAFPVFHIFWVSFYEKSLDQILWKSLFMILNLSWLALLFMVLIFVITDKSEAWAELLTRILWGKVLFLFGNRKPMLLLYKIL